MSTIREHNRSTAAEQDVGRAPALQRPRVLDRADLAQGETSYQFEGDDYGAGGASAIVVDAPPGSGPKLHTHPYAEIFVLIEGQATFTAGEDVIEAVAGQVVIVPAGVPHRFVNSGAGPLHQVDIHPSGRFSTQWLAD